MAATLRMGLADLISVLSHLQAIRLTPPNIAGGEKGLDVNGLDLRAWPVLIVLDHSQASG